MLNILKNKQMEFNRSILSGVEIKLCRNNPHSYKPHVHNELSLGYIVDGSTNLTFNDKTIHFGTGDGVIIPPLMTHQCAPNDIEHWAYIMLFVDPNYYHQNYFYHSKRLEGSDAEKIIQFITQLLDESTIDALENILIDLLIEFSEKEENEPNDENHDLLTKGIHDYILKNVREEISLQKLQELTNLNKFSIIRNFKKLYNSTPAAFHLQYKVAEAKKLLSKGVEALDICEELRFYDQAHFIREFKKMYGVTPGAYVEKLKD